MNIHIFFLSFIYLFIWGFSCFVFLGGFMFLIKVLYTAFTLSNGCALLPKIGIYFFAYDHHARYSVSKTYLSFIKGYMIPCFYDICYTVIFQ